MCPSRFIWFLVGGATAVWWLKSKEIEKVESYHRGCQRRHREIKERTGEDRPRSLTPPPSERRLAEEEPRKMASLGWEQERQRLQSISRQATDTMADMSEATLDSVLSTVEALKAKLAQHRAEREKFFQEHDEQWQREQDNSAGHRI